MGGQSKGFDIWFWAWAICLILATNATLALLGTVIGSLRSIGTSSVETAIEEIERTNKETEDWLK